MFKNKLIELLGTLLLNTLYPSLEFKCVDQTAQEYAIRINKKGYRALGHMQDDNMLWH
jgi:hypothetical protein